MKTTTLIFSFILLAGCGNNKSGSSENSERAVAISRQSFVQEIEKHRDDGDELSSYVSEINNYDVNVSDKGDYYEVSYILKQPRDGSVIKGGGGKYTIIKKTNAIAKYEGFE